MSADDFQTKYASFMEGIVKGTVAETTKLFETMVDELKAELSKVKMENEVLKTTRREKENGQSSSISESCQSVGPEMRDTAVQCDLLPGPPLLAGLDQAADQEEMPFTLLLDQDDNEQPDKAEVCEPTVGGGEVWCATAAEDARPEQRCSPGVPAGSTPHDHGSHETRTHSAQSLATPAAQLQSHPPLAGESEPAGVAVQQCGGLPLPQHLQVDTPAKEKSKEPSRKVKLLQRTARRTAVLSPSSAGHAEGGTSLGEEEMCLRSSTKTTPPPGSRKRRISTQDIDARYKKSQRKEPRRDGAAHRRHQSSRTRLSGRLASVSRKESTLVRVAARPRRPCSSTFAEEEHTPRHLKRPSHHSLLEKTAPSATHWVKLPQGATKPGESAAKTSRLKPNFSISENVKLRSGQRLAQAKISKVKKSNCAGDEVAASAPPAPAGEESSLRRTRSSFSPALSLRSQNHAVVFPPDPPRHPAMGSALLPLPVTGGPLLKNQCGECGRVLSSGAALESHLSLHKGHRPFSCTVCRKSFPDAKGLRRHDRVHRNGRIHTCQQCGKGFVYVYGLTKHLQMVHVKFKPFVCQICNKAFFTKGDVEDHIRLHTGEKPFHCHLCEKKFVKKVELKVHLKWHNGEKRHWCPYCGKGFFDYNNWKRHKYIHTGEKPHSCPHCPKHFKQSSHLKKHVRNVHKIQ
uniref:zinc finger and BTB domain-containing protein 17-like isoform X2 n=1 Tax=Doryrhamphus excisus TaxID=161450 RepID=UPI0025AE802F|nr:zinc finger and BTB domain-containing protein 17-like isoform X2 [Doryrhamphus excisus]